jgi:hypothetical protein
VVALTAAMQQMFFSFFGKTVKQLLWSERSAAEHAK